MVFEANNPDHQDAPTGVSGTSLLTSWMNMHMSDLAAICVTLRVLLVSVCCMFVVHFAFVQSLGSCKMKKKVCTLPTVLKEKRAKRIDKIVR